MQMHFIPGIRIRHAGPLARFLPSLDQGVVDEALKLHAAQAVIVIDPFGTSPILVREAAESGRSVVVAVNNPVTRFVLQNTLKPIGSVALRNALASLAHAPQDDGRLEPFLLDLYRTLCAHCGEYTPADYFIWDRELQRPIEKVYECHHCQHEAHESATEEDLELALMHEGRGMHRARAIGQVASADDPDRRNVEEALNVYPGRALYAIVTLINKIEQLSLPDEAQRAAQAVLLSTFDALNALWGMPEGRSRPLQLIADPRYREINAWKALEAAVLEWEFDMPEVIFSDWSADKPPERGCVSIFRGSARELLASQSPASVDAALSSFPRPNQAFWTLSAVWTAWLWGQEAAAPIKAALRRRRYDWAWHAAALRTSLIDLRQTMRTSSNMIGLVPDAEPGFVAAVSLGMERAGFFIDGSAYRTSPPHAIYLWRKEYSDKHGSQGLRNIVKQAVLDVLQKRGEPQSYSRIHHAAWLALSETGMLKQLASDEHPMQSVNELLEKVLLEDEAFVHLAAGIDVEAGQYWLSESATAAPPLADVIEQSVLELLRSDEQMTSLEFDRMLCSRLAGILTPDQRIILACLQSYAVEEDESGAWILRQEDMPEARKNDIAEIERMLIEIGVRLGFQVPDTRPIQWVKDKGQRSYQFSVSEMAFLGSALSSSSEPKRFEEILVVPGGRASLVAAKSRRNRWISTWLESGVRIMKFRHVRRLYAETTLTSENLYERMGIDPPGRHDPQMPLL
jgi:hypothetical protein